MCFKQKTAGIIRDKLFILQLNRVMLIFNPVIQTLTVIYGDALNGMFVNYLGKNNYFTIVFSDKSSHSI